MRREQVAFFNTHLMNNAERQVYSFSGDFDYLSGCEMRRGMAFLNELKEAPR